MVVIDILVIVVLILLPYLYFSKESRHRRKVARAVDKFGGPKWYPILGTTWSLLLTPREELFEKLHERPNLYGPIFRTWIGPIPVVHVTKAKHAEVILRSNVNIKKGKNYEFIRPWLGNGLITGSGPQWQRHRKLLTPTFHFKILDHFQEIFSEKGLVIVEELKPFANGEFFDVYSLVTHCALDIICETAMGVKINAIQDYNSKYVTALYRVMEIIIYRTFRPLLHSNFIFENSKIGKEHKELLAHVHGFVEKVIDDRKKKLQDSINDDETVNEEDELLGKKKRMAFLDLLLQHNMKTNELTDQEIREEVDTFMFAGHDTTTASTCWTLFSIGNYPEIQERVYQELESVFHGEERPITPEDLTQLPYMERVMKESMRLHSLVPAILRELVEEVELDGKTVPAGVTVAIHLTNVHLDPDQFPDPTRFDPDRFLPENVAGRSPYAYIPFSAGPRNCLGQKFAIRNTKTLLTSILRKYKVTSKHTPDEIKYFGDIVLKPQQGIHLSFEPRIHES